MKSFIRTATAAALLAFLAFLAMMAPLGCKPPCPSADTIVSRRQLVSEYNANAAAIPRLWARAKMQITLTDSKGRSFTWGSTSPLAAPNGLLLLAKGPNKPNKLGPHDFVLIGYETAATRLFSVGSSADEGVYYLWFNFGEHGRAWWGRHEYAGAPEVQALLIDPNQLLAVLSICEMPTDFTQPPTVAVSISTDPCAYVLTYMDRQVAASSLAGEIVFRREAYFRWSENEPRRPFLVNFFGVDGRRVMTAKLKNYRAIEVADVDSPPAAAPVMPTDIEINWPEKKSRVHMILSEMSTKDTWERSACGFENKVPQRLPRIQVDRALQNRPGEK